MPDRRFHLILLGAPGAGKSTQSRFLQQQYQLTVFATGQMLRDEVTRRTALGVLADTYLKKGLLLPDDVMVAIMTERLHALPSSQGVLLDGFPRTAAQAEALTDLMQEIHRPLDAAIALDLSDDVAIHRLGGRRICEGLGTPFALHIDDPESIAACTRLGGRVTSRPDDNPEVIRERLRVYDAETQPLLSYYDDRKLLQRISAAGEPEQVHAQITAILEAIGETH
ncbi:MAG: adenylate kinase [Herpetosiphon sp.]